MVKQVQILREGEVMNHWLENRLRKNKNALMATTGSTGSGKSYRDLRTAELWYKYRFKEEFNVDTNVCFSVLGLMNRLIDPNIRKGELLIFEEAGTALAALNFQQEVAKIFTFVLQSFRSKNILVIFNLPVLTMFNKTCRLLLHLHCITQGIDHTEKTTIIKPLIQQVNQEKGKPYWKYPRARRGRKMIKIKRLKTGMPKESLINKYEVKKFNFVQDLMVDFHSKLRKLQMEVDSKMARPKLTEKQREVFDMIAEGMNETEIAKKLGVTISAISDRVKLIRKKGFELTI